MIDYKFKYAFAATGIRDTFPGGIVPGGGGGGGGGFGPVSPSVAFGGLFQLDLRNKF